MKRPRCARPNASRRDPATGSSAAAGARPGAPGLLAAIVEHSNDAIFIRNLDGVITTWNAAAERIFGFRSGEILGQSSRVLLPRGQRDEFRKLMARLRRGEVVRQYETERLRKDGRRIRVSLTLSPVRGAGQRLIGFSTVARDVTEEERMKELLARRERELQDLFDQASVGLVLVARRGTILRANEAFLDVLGRPAGQVIGRPLGAFHPEPAAVADLLRRLSTRQTLHNFPTELIARDSQPRPVLVDANALWDAGRFVHSRWFVRDISRRKQLEHELLEAGERERRAFAQELHDGLGQQLGGVAYLCNVLSEQLAERGAAEAPDAARIFGLVRDAIEQTRRISRGLSPIQPEPDGLMSALRELARQMRDLFRVRCRFDCRQPVRLDDSTLAGHLFRIAQEAVNNALKHAKPRAITLRLRQVRNHVQLIVADNGKGIGPIAPRRQGLGLHIMQYRAGLVRGTLTVQVRKGGGTEMICTAPCARPPRRTRPN